MIDETLEYIFKHPIKSIIAATTALSILWGGYHAIGNKIEYSKGTRVGVINKFSEKGLIWKKYDGQLALEGIVSNNNRVGANVWDFSLDNLNAHGGNKKELVKKISEYMEKSEKVKINYIQPIACWPWQASSNYLIQSVEPIEKSK